MLLGPFPKAIICSPSCNARGDLPNLSLFETGRPAYTRTRFGTVYGLRNSTITGCPGNLTSEMSKASPNDMATGSSLHYFAHIVKVKFVLTHLLTVLTKHACQHNSFWGSKCVSSHTPTISLKPVLFTAISALIFRH